eukprot:753763-Hanusia_phi.AAC.2
MGCYCSRSAVLGLTSTSSRKLWNGKYGEEVMKYGIDTTLTPRRRDSELQHPLASLWRDRQGHPFRGEGLFFEISQGDLNHRPAQALRVNDEQSETWTAEKKRGMEPGT